MSLIAASIVYMAFENIVGSRWEKRWVIAFGFGLVHGFGFSFALSEMMQFAGGLLVTEYRQHPLMQDSPRPACQVPEVNLPSVPRCVDPGRKESVLMSMIGRKQRCDDTAARRGHGVQKTAALIRRVDSVRQRG